MPNLHEMVGDEIETGIYKAFSPECEEENAFHFFSHADCLFEECKDSAVFILELKLNDRIPQELCHFRQPIC